MAQQIVYKKMFVAFLDVLGFKELIKTSAGLRSIQQYFDAANEVIDEIRAILSKQSIQSIIISDSVILAIDCPENNDTAIENLRQLCIAIGMFQQKMAHSKLWIRGAVSCGDAFFSENPVQVVGPAFVKAYLLEEKLAKYPRVILDGKIVSELQFSCSQDFIENINLKQNGGLSYENWKKGILFDWVDSYGGGERISQDVPLFIDFFSSLVVSNDYQKIKTIVNNIRMSIYENVEVYDKYRWLINYFIGVYLQCEWPNEETGDEEHLAITKLLEST